MYKFFCTSLILISFYVFPAKAQIFPIDTLQYQGNTSTFINFVILGDGYTLKEQNKFENDATRFITYLFNQSPFIYYKDYFNVFIIKVPSPESGVKHPRTALDCPDSMPFANPNNYFGSSFDKSGIHRLVSLSNNVSVGKVLAENFPEYDQVLLLANSNQYGGSGGSILVATVNAASNEIAVHELGHSFANLADEYWAGAGYAGENANRTQETKSDLIKWKNWLGFNGIGIYNYGGRAPLSIWYRPSEYCKMQYLGYPFCSVCTEAIIEKIHSLVYPIRSVYPAANQDSLEADSLKKFSVSLVKPIPNTLKTQWFINNKLIANNTESIQVDPGFFTDDSNSVRFNVIDTTKMVRDENHFKNHLYSITWKIKQSQLNLKPPIIKWNPVEVCLGTATTLSVLNPEAGVQYNWYNDSVGGRKKGEGANFVTSSVSSDTAYFVEATVNGKISKRTKISIKVLPIPLAPKLVVADAQQVAFGNSTRLKVATTDSLLNYRWYISETGIGSLGEDTIIVSPGLTSKTIYFVESVFKKTGCASSKRTKIVVSVMKKPLE